jgi:glycosyltransferase involved in cell wall biosynthesis
VKILFASYAFSPSIGGIESVSATLATQFVKAGHEIQLMTETRAPDRTAWPFPVLRRPTGCALWRAIRWGDVCFHNNLSLNLAWPLFFLRRPGVVAHQTWIARTDRKLAWQDLLKRWLLRFAENISISHAIAASLPVPSTIIGNPYDDSVFQEIPGVERKRDLIFVGRLVSDKGVDLLLEALAQIKWSEGCTPRLTVIGAGPEESALRVQAHELGIAGQVHFAGTKSGNELAGLLNEHHVLVVPSRWEEPFGVVALEGIACGCVVVGSASGGLRDAIGTCGLTFPNGNMAALVAALRVALEDAGVRQRCRAAAAEHLARHRPGNVARAYLDILEKARR